MGKKNPPESESILLAAVELINENGIVNLSIGTIARRQGIPEDHVYHYYADKDQLALSLLEYYVQRGNNVMDAIQEKGIKPEEAILWFAQAYMEWFQSIPALTCFFGSEFYRYNGRIAEKYLEIKQKHFNFFNRLIREGQEAGEIHSKSQSSELAVIIMGSVSAVVFKWGMQNCGFDLKEEAISVIRKLLEV